ncbi:hypothetical protein EWB00_008023 [Schistosoma japonicum]|uniref:Uncharacterized protein n=1 Tax=Schistosoma japonicum TaxID=6182 RepID=A0A4Z2CRY5_SCHJA|nr:hypothetical protein EWB00_008023 [Schistosoma japonicum]
MLIEPLSVDNGVMEVAKEGQLKVNGSEPTVVDLNADSTDETVTEDGGKNNMLSAGEHAVVDNEGESESGEANQHGESPIEATSQPINTTRVNIDEFGVSMPRLTDGRVELVTVSDTVHSVNLLENQSSQSNSSYHNRFLVFARSNLDIFTSLFSSSLYPNEFVFNSLTRPFSNMTFVAPLFASNNFTNVVSICSSQPSFDSHSSTLMKLHVSDSSMSLPLTSGFSNGFIPCRNFEFNDTKRLGQVDFGKLHDLEHLKVSNLTILLPLIFKSAFINIQNQQPQFGSSFNGHIHVVNSNTTIHKPNDSDDLTYILNKCSTFENCNQTEGTYFHLLSIISPSKVSGFQNINDHLVNKISIGHIERKCFHLSPDTTAPITLESSNTNEKTTNNHTVDDISFNQTERKYFHLSSDTTITPITSESSNINEKKANNHTFGDTSFGQTEKCFHLSPDTTITPITSESSNINEKKANNHTFGDTSFGQTEKCFHLSPDTTITPITSESSNINEKKANNHTFGDTSFGQTEKCFHLSPDTTITPITSESSNINEKKANNHTVVDISFSETEKCFHLIRKLITAPHLSEFIT